MTQSADTLIYNAKILTMDPKRPTATALTILGETILAVGDLAQLDVQCAATTKRINAGGKTVLPGLNESHIHIFPGSTSLEQLSLFEKSGFDTICTLIRDYGAAHPSLPIIHCLGASHTLLGEGRKMDRHVLDSILPDRPLALTALDLHTVWANTKALEQADLLRGKDLSPGNEIVMGMDGLATGQLNEIEAFSPVYCLSTTQGREQLGLMSGRDPAPPPTRAQRNADKEVLYSGLKHLASFGITSFQNMDGNRYTLELLAELHGEGRLLCRGRIPGRYVTGNVDTAMDYAADLRTEYQGDYLNSGTIKYFIDGVLDSYTALMTHPYADRPGWKGEPRIAPTLFDEIVCKADKKRLQIAVHSIGDGATKMVLDAYAKAQKRNGKRDSRHRIEHLEVVREEDFARLKELGVTAAMQPPHPPGQCGLPLEPTISRIGKQNWPRAYAWRRMLDEGIPLTLSSDWPVSSVNPWESVHSAMTRMPWHDSQPDNRLSLLEALACYTTTPAYAEFAEDKKGMLRAGYYADVTVLNQDITTLAAEDIQTVQAVLTLCGGTVTFERG